MKPINQSKPTAQCCFRTIR